MAGWRLTMLQAIRTAKRLIVGKRDGEASLRGRYARIHGGELDLNNAKTFTQKLYRRMIEYHRRPTPLETMLVDKFEVRRHIAKEIGEQYSVPLIWAGEDPGQIPFDALPDICIAKCTHGSSINLTLRQPIDKATAVSTLKRWLSENHYWRLREAHYFNVKPRVVIEDLISDGRDDGPLDYRMWCFGGKVKLIQIDNAIKTINPIYTPDWELTEVTCRTQDQRKPVPRPENLDQMIELAERLSRQFDFVRVDLYNVHGRIYFGEFTFTPTAGVKSFDPAEWDLRVGEMWPD